MSVINKLSPDPQKARELSLIADGKLRVRNLRVKTPQGYKHVRTIRRINADTYELVT